MRIGIDARMMGAGNTRGIGRYIQELISALLTIDASHTFVLLHRDPSTSPFLHHVRVEHICADVPWYSVLEQTHLPRFVRDARAEFFHFPHWNIPIALHSPYVVTIHDLLLLHQPSSAKASTHSPIVAFAKRLGHRLVLKRAVERARMICAPTQFVANDLMQTMGVPSNRIVMTGEGLSRLPLPDTSRVPTKPYLLYVGSAYPHKRLDVLLDAWPMLSQRHLALQLVIAGEKDVFMQRHADRVRRDHLERVHFPGRLSDAELAGFFSLAALFVFPSSHEGFGLPPLEALSFGCPVIVSDIAVLREVLPTSGVFFFREGDKDAMIRTIETQLDRLSDARREAKEGGSIGAKRHDWHAVARSTLAVYEKITSRVPY